MSGEETLLIALCAVGLVAGVAQWLHEWKRRQRKPRE